MPSVDEFSGSGSESEEQLYITSTTTTPRIIRYQSISGWVILGVFLMVCMVFFMFCYGKRIESMCNSCKYLYLGPKSMFNRCCCRSRTTAIDITSNISVPITVTKYKSGEEAECNICLGEINNKTVVKLQCGHYYHKSCITKWFSQQVGDKLTPSCPSCRSFTFTMDNQSFSKLVIPSDIIVFR